MFFKTKEREISKFMKQQDPPNNGEGEKQDLHNKDLHGWSFHINEISNGYYRVEGWDRVGHVISRDGLNPDELIEKCKDDIREIFLVGK